jgi:trk system potassium uptake protein TrkH
MTFNFRMIFRFLGILTFLNGVLMLFCLPFAAYYKEPAGYLILSSLAAMSSGGFFLILNINKYKLRKEFTKKDGFLIVTLGWIFMSIFGSLPYFLSGAIPDFSNAFFETISGYTTTGASI